MSTDAQISANQANAELSTGPRTAAGKAASSRNNLRHGFRSQSVLLPGDDPADYDALLAELTAHFIPLHRMEGLTDQRFVREMADAEWRLRRVRGHMESAIARHISTIAADHPDADPLELQSLAIESLAGTGTSYSTWLRYESKFERQYDRAYKDWTRYQEASRRVSAQEADILMKRALFSDRPVSDPILASNVHNPVQPIPSAQAATRAAVVRDKVETRSNVQNFSAPITTPRNSPCPCGSGLKFKTGMRVCRGFEEESVDGGIPNEEANSGYRSRGSVQ